MRASLLTLLVALTIVGCARPKASELVQAIQGDVTSLTIGGAKLEELPANFDLNPTLTEFRAKSGFPLITKQVAVLASTRRVGLNNVSVQATPFIESDGRPGFLLTREARDAVEWRVSKTFKETVLTSKGRGELVVYVLGTNGLEMPEVAPGWCLFLALAGKDGIMCWNETVVQDTVIAPRSSGFRRFRLEGSKGSEGWQLLKPILPK